MKTLFSASELTGLPNLTRDWLRSADPALRSLLPLPRPRGARTQPLPDGRARPWEPLLAALARRNTALGNPRSEQLVAKLRDGAVAVIAGQQVGLFGGPLLTLYKALEAVRISREIEAGGTPAVPLFWMASEDHDLAEVLEARVRAGGGVRKFEIPESARGNRKPVGALTIGPGPSDFLKQHDIEIPASLLAALEPERSFSDSFAAILLAALGEREILLVDPAMPEAKWSLSDFFARAFRGIQQMQQLLAEREDQIGAAGYDLQVVHRPGQCHVFSLENGDRLPLDVFDDGRIGVRDGDPRERRAPEEWARLAEEHPDRLSPAVLLRPAAASRLFPQAVAVLGPSEVAYWAQALSLFPLFGSTPPDLAPRPHVFLLEPASRRLLEKVGVGVNELLGGTDAVLAHLVQRETGGPLADFRSKIVGLRHHLVEAENAMVAIDPTLRGFYAHAADKITLQLNALVRKGEEAWARRDEIRSRQVDRLTSMLAPEGIPQERHDPLLEWVIRSPGFGDSVWEGMVDAVEGGVIGIELGRAADEEQGPKSGV